MQLVGALGFEPRTGRLRVCCDRRFTILPGISGLGRTDIARLSAAAIQPLSHGSVMGKGSVAQCARSGNGVTAHLPRPAADTSPKPPCRFEPRSARYQRTHVLHCHCATAAKWRGASGMIRMPMGHALFSKQAQEPSWLYSPAEGGGYAPQRQCRPLRTGAGTLVRFTFLKLAGGWQCRSPCLCGTTRVQAEAGSRPG